MLHQQTLLGSLQSHVKRIAVMHVQDDKGKVSYFGNCYNWCTICCLHNMYSSLCKTSSGKQEMQVGISYLLNILPLHFLRLSLSEFFLMVSRHQVWISSTFPTQSDMGIRNLDKLNGSIFPGEVHDAKNKE